MIRFASHAHLFLKSGLLLAGLLLVCGVELAAQQETIVTKNFSFKDGIYQSFTDFQANRPTCGWKEVRANVFTNPQTFLTQIEYLEWKDRDREDTLQLNEIWGVTIGGIPYIRLPKGSIQKEMTSFAGLQVRGSISYFKYEVTETRAIEITAYNPANGRPFRQATVEREIPVWKEFMLDFEDGTVVPFNLENLKAWIANDDYLLQSVEDYSLEEAQKRMFKILLIYCDRNPAYIVENEE